jgi:hypothetical protein
MGAARAQRWENAWRILSKGVTAAVALAFVVMTVSVAFAPEVLAQERPRRWFSIRQLFAPRIERDPPRVLRDLSDLPRVKAQRARQASKKKRSAPREPEVVVKEKAPDARVVLIVGDFLGGALAQGLSVAYAENPGVTVIDRTRASSGFVRQDVHDWPAEIKALIEKEKPVAVVMMLGSNDRQPMRVGDTREPPRSTSWLKEYEQRAQTFAKAVADAGAPLLWLGMPSFKSTKMSEDMLAFNEMYRATATAAGGEFIDVWDGFIDENGAFVTSGPDINGQPVRLRTSDGINFTKAGKRKLAFYAEKPLAKILGLPGTGVPADVAALPAVPIDPKAPVPTDRTPPMSLDDPALDGGSELLGATPAAGDRATGSGLLRGAAQPKAIAGRADDFSWPPQIAAPAATEPLPTDQATAATR